MYGVILKGTLFPFQGDIGLVNPKAPRTCSETSKKFSGEKKFKQVQERDKKKIRLSKLNNITLIVVPYTVTNFEKYFEDYFYFM